MAKEQDLFIELLKGLRASVYMEALSELVNDCRTTGEKGDITVKISIKPEKGDSGQYFVSEEIKVNTPKC